jgi:hypothetical protein
VVHQLLKMKKNELFTVSVHLPYFSFQNPENEGPERKGINRDDREGKQMSGMMCGGRDKKGRPGSPRRGWRAKWLNG